MPTATMNEDADVPNNEEHIPLFDSESPYDMILANLRDHLREFKAWLIRNNKSENTAEQYTLLVRSMLVKADIRDDAFFADVLSNYNPNTRSSRITARNNWMAYIGAPVSHTPGVKKAYNLPTGGGTLMARKAKVLRMLDASIAQFVELEKGGATLPDLLDETRVAYERAQRNYERRRALQAVPMDGRPRVKPVVEDEDDSNDLPTSPYDRSADDVRPLRSNVNINELLESLRTVADGGGHSPDDTDDFTSESDTE